MRDWRKLSELMAYPVLFRWWDADCGERAVRSMRTGGSWIAASQDQDVNLKYLRRTKSLYCHLDNASGESSLKYFLSSLVLLPSRALRDHSHLQIYKETEYSCLSWKFHLYTAAVKSQMLCIDRHCSVISWSRGELTIKPSSNSLLIEVRWLCLQATSRVFHAKPLWILFSWARW